MFQSKKWKSSRGVRHEYKSRLLSDTSQVTRCSIALNTQLRNCWIHYLWNVCDSSIEYPEENAQVISRTKKKKKKKKKWHTKLWIYWEFYNTKTNYDTLCFNHFHIPAYRYWHQRKRQRSLIEQFPSTKAAGYALTDFCQISHNVIAGII